MFDSVELTASDDVGVLTGAIFVQRSGTTRSQQPCPALVDRCCAVYAHRPAACRAFECDVLSAVHRGDLPFADALDLISRAVHLSTTVRPQLERLLDRPTGLEELARRAGIDDAHRSATMLRRPVFPQLLLDVQRHLRESPDSAARIEEAAAILDDAGELYMLLTDRFGLAND